VADCSVAERGSSGDEDDFDDLFYRIEELEEELESKESTLGTVQDSQQQVADQVEEMNDTVRQLLGVYDMLTDDVNPFTGAGEERNGFGVFGEDKATTDGGSESMAGPGRSGLSGARGDGLVRRSQGSYRGRGGSDGADETGGKTITFDEDEGDDDTRVEVQATESVDDTSSEPSSDADGADVTADDDESDVTLESLADTYATDIIVPRVADRTGPDGRAGGDAACDFVLRRDRLDRRRGQRPPRGDVERPRPRRSRRPGR